MKLVRVGNDFGVDFVAQYLEPEDGRTLEETVTALKGALRQWGQDIFLLEAIEGDELVGFLLATGVFSPFVSILQVWGDSQDKLFFRLCLWADMIGKPEIRAETRRVAHTALKDWGFEKFSHTLKFDVPEDLGVDFLKPKTDNSVPVEKIDE